MKPAPIALLLTLSMTALAQNVTPHFTDPANLAGERVKPKDGRELPIDQGASGLQQMLRRLNTRSSILNIVAHPDDEDGGMLTLYSRGLGARVADLSLTRGEGGQNAMTGDFEDALGLLRTQELLANDRYIGVDQMFGTEVDFGFSKTKEEAFAKWTHQRVLYDVVRAIRIYRPLVITATFIGGVTDGHGQHQVSGEIAQEAFKAAGDPKVFAELTAEGILPWQPLKVYARVPMQAITPRGLFDYATGQYTEAKFTNYVTGEVTATPPSTDVTVHEGTVDPLLLGPDGRPGSYVQFARIGLGLQKSQIGPGVRSAPSGDYDVAYHLYAKNFAYAHADTREEDFFDGIDTSIQAIATLAPAASGDIAVVLNANLTGIQHSIEQAQLDFRPDHPELAVNRLREALTLANGAIRNVDAFTPNDLPAEQKENLLHELRIKRVQLNDALVLALGLQLDAQTPNADLLAGETVPIKVELSLLSPNPIAHIKQAILNQAGEGTTTQSVDGEVVPTPDRPLDRTLQLRGKDTSIISRPYFFRTDIEQPVYQLSDSALRDAATTPPALVVQATLDFQDVRLELNRVVHAGTQPVSIVPPASLATLSHAQVFPRNAASALVSFAVIPPGTPIETNLPKDWKIVPDVEPTNSQPGFKQFRLEPSTVARNAFTLAGIALLPNSVQITEGYRPVGYGDLPRTNYFTPATDRIVPVDLKLLDRHKLAYLPGTGDAVPEALATIGLSPTILTVADLTASRLAQFDTVILGVRTYNAHPELHGDPTRALIEYAKNGGNVVVQYQTMEFTADDAPYPLALGSNEKVVDETAPVRLIEEHTDPGVRLFYAPNHITPADFNGWIEERGHGFLSTWDPRYSAPTETHDPGQDPQRGGLITVKLGDDPKHQGRWTYCAFAIYRQLPEAVPGAYRFFLNLINPD